MKRTAGALLVAVAMGGCASTGHKHGPATAGPGCNSCGSHSAMAVPGVQGPWGQPVAMMPHTAQKPAGMKAGPTARGKGGEVIHAGGMMMPMTDSGIKQMAHHGHPLAGGHVGTPPWGAVAAAGSLQPGMGDAFPAKRTEVRFLGPDGTRVRWMTTGPDGRPMPSPQSLTVPGRYNVLQAAKYRLKLDIPREDLPALYPTLEVVPSNARTDTFLDHSAVPVAFTNEDFDQVRAGNYVIKVVYLPDPQFQDLATAGPEEIVSTRLEPGADPIAEAYRRGNILLVVRFGNIDLELQHSPPLHAPGPLGPMGAVPVISPIRPAVPVSLPVENKTPPPPRTSMNQETTPAKVQPARFENAKAAAATPPAKTTEAAKTTATTESKPTTKPGMRWWNLDKK